MTKKKLIEMLADVPDDMDVAVWTSEDECFGEIGKIKIVEDSEGLPYSKCGDFNPDKYPIAIIRCAFAG